MTWAPPAAGDLAGPFRFLAWLARSQARRIVLAGVFGITWMAGLAVPPWLLARAVDQGLVARDPGALIGWALILVAATVLIALLSIARHRTMTKIRMDASFRCVRTTVWHTSRLGASLARRVSAGEVVTVGIADVQVVAQALTVTGPGVGAVVAYALVAVVLFTTSPLLAAVVLGGVPLLAIIVGPLLRRIEHTGGEYRAHQGQLTTRLVDVLGGLRVLNGLGGKAFVGARYEQQSQDLIRHGYRVAGPTSWVGALSVGLPALFLAAVVWLSARLAAAGEISIGEVVAVHGYVAMLVIPVASLIEGGGDLARARVAGRRILGLLNLPVSSADEDVPARIPSERGPLVDAASGVIIRPGLLTSLVAAKPSDAVAVIERLGRLFRSRVIIADTDAELFAGTVRDVVAGRLDPDDRQIQAALRAAVAEDIVEALPYGLDTVIAAGGTDLSGGQRQRIRLARALYAAPEILLAVDPTSAVDANTEAAMIERLRQVRGTATTVISTTSPLVLDRSDEVVVLVDGRVTAVGRHDDLLRSDATYRDLVSRAQGDDDHG